MGYLQDKSVYLCGPLHGCDDDGKNWRELITPNLTAYGIHVEDPTKKTINGIGEVGLDKKNFQSLIMEKKFTHAKETFWPLCRADLRAVDKADFLILNYDPTIPTVGTWNEVTNAVGQKKPVLLKYNENQLDKFNIWVLTYIKEGCIFSTWEEMFLYLDKVNNGIFNTSYWTI